MRAPLCFLVAGLLAACSRTSDHRAAVPPATTSTAEVPGLASATNTQPLPDDAPTVVVDREHVLIDGAVVGDLKPIVEVGRIQRIDEELAALQAKREAWKAAHAGASFPGVAVLRVPRDTKALLVKSVFQTAAFAGYPSLAFAVGTGSPRRMAALPADAQVPFAHTGDKRPREEKVLHVSLAPDRPVTLSWVRGAELLSVTDVPRAEAFQREGDDVRGSGLGAKVTAQWTQQREHYDDRDEERDRAVLHVDDAVEMREIAAALDALYFAKRPLGGATVSAFEVTLSPGAAPDKARAGVEANGKEKIGAGPLTADGRLPPEVIRRIIRQSSAQFRACYEAGLAKSPGLQGKVVVKFTIAKDGSVATVGDGGSTLADAAVRTCILKAFSALSFPAPEGGTVSVTYPLQLSPG